MRECYHVEYNYPNRFGRAGSPALWDVRGDKEPRKRQRGLRSVKKGYPSRCLYGCLDYQYESIREGLPACAIKTEDLISYTDGGQLMFEWFMQYTLLTGTRVSVSKR